MKKGTKNNNLYNNFDERNYYIGYCIQNNYLNIANSQGYSRPTNPLFLNNLTHNNNFTHSQEI